MPRTPRANRCVRQSIIALHILLYLIDGLPLLLILFSITAHIVYLQNFTATWPFLSLTSARFLGSCAMVVADHFLWFFYFAEKAQEAKRWNGSAKRFRQQAGVGGKQGPTFMDVAAFFAVCVWFVPLFLFLSLSANDNVLPQMGESRRLAIGRFKAKPGLCRPSTGNTIRLRPYRRPHLIPAPTPRKARHLFRCRLRLPLVPIPAFPPRREHFPRQSPPRARACARSGDTTFRAGETTRRRYHRAKDTTSRVSTPVTAVVGC